MLEALAKATGIEAERVRRAAMMAGEIPAVFARAVFEKARPACRSTIFSYFGQYSRCCAIR